MSCKTFNNTCQLYFPSPRNGRQQDFIIYFYPDIGEQSNGFLVGFVRRIPSVITCETHNGEQDCLKDPGFQWEEHNSTHALMILPSHIAAKSGRFRYQIAQQPIESSWSCFWSSVDSCTATSITITSEAGYSSTPMGIEPLPSKSENHGEKDNTALIVGLSLGLGLLLLVLLVVVAIKLFKKRKSAGGVQHSKSEKRTEEGQENDTVIRDYKKSAIDGYKNKGSGVEPVQLSGKLQNFPTELPIEKKGSDISFSPCVPPVISIVMIDDHSRKDADQVNPRHLSFGDYERQPSSSSESDSSTRSNESSKPLLQNQIE